MSLHLQVKLQLGEGKAEVKAAGTQVVDGLAPVRHNERQLVAVVSNKHDVVEAIDMNSKRVSGVVHVNELSNPLACGTTPETFRPRSHMTSADLQSTSQQANAHTH